MLPNVLQGNRLKDPDSLQTGALVNSGLPKRDNVPQTPEERCRYRERLIRLIYL